MLITGQQAQLLLGITTRQGLHKYIKKYNIPFKNQANGLPNLYEKEDIEKLKEIIGEPKHTHNAIKEKVKKRVTQIKTNKKNIEKVKTETKKALKIEDKPKEDLIQNSQQQIDKPSVYDIENPLNEVGIAEYERVTQLLIEQGTYKELDRALVLAYAISYQKYIFATVASGKQDDTTMNDFGDLKLHPYFLVAKESFNQMEKTAKLLGIGARNRIGLEIVKPKKESIFDILNAKEEWKWKYFYI